MTQSLTDAEIAALRDLRELWPQEQLVLIGASALSLHLPLRWRVTQDLDVSVSSARWRRRAILARIRPQSHGEGLAR